MVEKSANILNNMVEKDAFFIKSIVKFNAYIIDTGKNYSYNSLKYRGNEAGV